MGIGGGEGERIGWWSSGAQVCLMMSQIYARVLGTGPCVHSRGSKDEQMSCSQSSGRER